MDLESVAGELYQAAPEEFVERRKNRAAEARTAKDRPLVKAITQLRRPTRSAWLVNLLAHESGDDVAGLLELGAALGDAQRRGAGAELRRLSKERQVTLDRLTRQAVALAAARGHSATEATRQEVSQTLQAALADPAVSEVVRSGRVVQPASYGGFGPLDLFGGGLTLVPDLPEPAGAALGADDAFQTARPPAAGSGVQAAAEKEPTEAEKQERRDREAAIGAAHEKLAEARQGVETAREDAARAESDADEATADADRLAERVEDLRTRLREAEEEERLAGQRARAARKRSQELHRAAAGADQRMTAAQRELDDLSPA